MVRTMINKSDYVPCTKVAEGIYKIMFDRQDVQNDLYEEDADGNRIPTGEKEETDYCTVNTEIIRHRPTIGEIKTIILSWYNDEIDRQILSGFSWQGMAVWLSTENQFNYKAAYDLAVQTGGASLPITVKFGTTEAPQYHTFETVDEFAGFFTSAMAYIQQTLAAGWAKKDAVDFSAYEKVLNEQ